MQISAGGCESQVAAVDTEDVISASYICFKKLEYPAWVSSKTLVTEGNCCDQWLGTGEKNFVPWLIIIISVWALMNKIKRWFLNLLHLPLPMFSCLCVRSNQPTFCPFWLSSTAFLLGWGRKGKFSRSSVICYHLKGGSCWGKAVVHRVFGMRITSEYNKPPSCPMAQVCLWGFSVRLKTTDHASVLIKGADLCLGKGHFEAELYQIKLKIVVVFSSDEKDDRRQGKYWGKNSGTRGWKAKDWKLQKWWLTSNIKVHYL